MKIGQRYQYAGGTLLVGRIEGDVIHIAVESTPPIQHMPFSRLALQGSLMEKIAEGVPIPSSFEEGYSQWKSAQGGVFEIPVGDAVSAVHSILDDEFDELVRLMREQRSQAKIDELYERLFQLDMWYFLGRPEEPEVPVIWDFPDGHNPSPCILAFTSTQRATVGAQEIDLPEAALISAPTLQAIAWLRGPLSQNEGLTWACFNLGSRNFPLYFDMMPM